MYTNIPQNPNYIHTTEIANNFLINNNIDHFPVDPIEIISNIDNCDLYTVEELSELSKRTEKEIIESVIRSKDGATLYDEENNYYTIIYNKKILSPGRIRFTLAHELGHIVLKHLEIYEQTRISRRGLNNKENNVLEKEANTFAGLVLAHPKILQFINIINYKQLLYICSISKEAAKFRFKYYKKNLSRPITLKERQIITQFLPYIESKKYYKYIYFTCSNCFGYLLDKNIKYCPYCGIKIQKKRFKERFNMIYDGYKLDSNSKAVICPVCNNELIPTNGEYCNICGTYIVNKCTYEGYDDGDPEHFIPPCGTKLDGTARFCHVCGKMSTFYRDNILKSWDGELKEKEELVITKNYEFDDDLPF